MDWVKIFDLAPGKRIYQYLKNTTPEEREILCRDATFSDMCSLIDVETRTKLTGPEFTRYGHDSLLNILESFHDFDTAMEFIRSVRPGFIYSEAFKEFVETQVVYENETSRNEDVLTYTLGKRYKYKIIDNRFDNVIRTTLDDELHSFGDQPAIVYFTRQEKIVAQQWFKYGKQHRENDKPALIEYYPNTNFIQSKEWFINGNSYRQNNLPSQITYFEPINGVVYVRTQIWGDHPDGIILVKYYSPDENGVQHKSKEIFKIRLNKPTEITYYRNGNLKKIEYRYNYNRLHRTNGPAVIKFKKDDPSVTTEIFYRNGRRQGTFEDAE